MIAQNLTWSVPKMYGDIQTSGSYKYSYWIYPHEITISFSLYTYVEHRKNARIKRSDPGRVAGITPPTKKKWFLYFLYKLKATIFITNLIQHFGASCKSLFKNSSGQVSLFRKSQYNEYKAAKFSLVLLLKKNPGSTIAYSYVYQSVSDYQTRDIIIA